jgi:oligosaccharide repeat unit polymerase
VTAIAAFAIAAATLYLGRRDVTRPAVAFGTVWFGLIAVAQLRLTQIETAWSTGFTLLAFAGGLLFMAAAVVAGGTDAARGRIALARESYQPKRLVTAALVLFVGALAGTAYKADVLGGVPLLSGRADELRARAYQGGEAALPTWSTALTDGFFLALWCCLAALWVLRGRTSRRKQAALALLAVAALVGVGLFASRNTVMLALAVPLVAAYLVARPGSRMAGVQGFAVATGIVVLVVGGLYAARLSQANPGRDTFLERESARQPITVRPVLPLYVNGVYPFEAASRVYRAVPEPNPYTLGAASLTSLPDAAFPDGGKPQIGSTMGRLMESKVTEGFGWTVGTYQARLLFDAGWAGVLLGSLLLGLGFGALYRWARPRSGFLPAALVGFLAYYAAFMAYDNQLSFSLIAVYDLAIVALVGALSRRALPATER